MLFNNVAIGEYVVVEHIRRTFLPPIEPVTGKIPGQDGELFISRNLGPGKIEVDLRLLHDNKIDMQERAREVAALLYNPGLAPLILRDDPTRYVMAMIEGDSALDTYLGIGLSTVTFICPDPISYSIEEKQIILPAQIHYTGTRPNRGIIEVNVTSNTDYIHIRDLRTGKFLRVGEEGLFKTGDKIIFDCRKDKELVLRDGLSLMEYLNYNSDFFDINSETTKIDIFTGADNNGPEFPGVLKVREGWL